MTKYLVERYLPGLTPEQLAAAAGSAKRTTATMTQEGTRAVPALDVHPR